MWRSLVLALHQSLLHTFEQSGFIEGLAQETDRPRIHCSLSNPVMRKGSNKDDRHAVIVSNQMVLQLDAGHAGHLHVGNDAGRFAQLRRRQELLCRSERVYRKSHRLKKRCVGGTYRGSSSTTEIIG